MKQCSSCNEVKDISKFFSRISRKSGGVVRAWCKSCCAEYDRQQKLSKGTHDQCTKCDRLRVKSHFQYSAESGVCNKCATIRKCTSCKEIKPADAFYYNNHFTCHVAKCKACCNTVSQEISHNQLHYSVVTDTCFAHEIPKYNLINQLLNLRFKRK